MIIVVEPGARSLQTAHTIKRLAGEIHIPNVGVVINKVMPGMEIDHVKEALDGLPLLGVLPYDRSILDSDVANRCPWTGGPAQVETVEKLVRAIEAMAGT
jgi:CO dehydrogenase maturation factor